MTDQETHNMDEQPVETDPEEDMETAAASVSADDPDLEDELEDEEEQGDDLLPVNKRVVFGALGIVAALAIAAAAWFLFLKPATPVVITVNGETLRGQQFSDRVAFEYYLQTGGQPIAQIGITPEMFAEFARDGIIDGMIIDQHAAQEGVEVSEEEITAEEERVFGLTGEEGGLTQEQYEAQYEDYFTGFAESSGLTRERINELWRARLRTALLARGLLEVLALPVDLTQEEAHAAHILVETEEEAQAVLDRLDAGEEFADIAAEVSIDTGSAVQGGDLGFFPRGVMVGPFEDAVFALEAGEISEPTQTQFGYHIIYLIEKGEQPVSEQAQAQQENELFRAELAGWHDASDILIDDAWVEYVPALP